MTEKEFDLLTDKIRGQVSILYFHLMGEPLLHPLLPTFVRKANEKGFNTVITSNGTLINKADELLDSLPRKIQLSLHSHEGNDIRNHSEYINKVIDFSKKAAEKGTCIVLRLWNQGGQEKDNDVIEAILEKRIPRPWTQRPDGYKLCKGIYLEYDRKFEWPDESNEKQNEVFCFALTKQIGVLVDGSVVPCCLDHDGKVILGNLFNDSLQNILSSPRAKALLDGFVHHTATEKLCQHCESAAINKTFRGK